MAKLMFNGMLIEGTVEELSELMQKVGGLGAANGDNFRKVEGREPRVGDYIKFFEDDLDITAGKYYEIIDVDDDGDFVFLDDDGDNQYVSLYYLGEDFEVFEKVGGEKPLKVGDYVVPLKSADDVYGVTNTEMKLGKVVEGEVDCCGEIRIEVVAHENDIEVGESYSVEPKYFRKATQEEIDAALKQMLKVGDYVKIFIPEGEHPKYGWGSVSNGDVGKITEIQGKKIIVEFPKQKGWLGVLGEFVKATDEEVAKAKLAKLGRKPGEFKKGDIVRVINASFSGHENGDISEIIKQDEIKRLYEVKKMRDTVFGGWLGPDAIELVAPVESRVDTE